MKTSKLLQTEAIITATPHDSLSTVLNKLPSSHSAAFIFNDEKKYMGVINPYYCVIKTSHPSNAKVEHCLFHAPHVKMQHTSGKIAQMMIESKIHYLPVFDDQEKFVGMVSARNILRTFEFTNVFTTTIAEMMKLKKRPLVVIKEEETIEQAIHLFKESRLSKLVVISAEGKLRGVLSYYDLISFLMSPKKERGPQGIDKSAMHTRKVKHFAKSFVLTLEPEDFARDALHLIIEKKIGSIIVVDKNNKPLDIITTRDMLTLLIREPGVAKVEMSTKNLSLKSNIVTKNFFERLKDTIIRKRDVSKAKLFVKEEKQGGLFRVVLSLIPKRGKPKVVAREGKNLESVLQEVKKEE